MRREKGYVSPLLSNLAVDYSAKVRESMVGSRLFPRILVGKPSGKYALFDKENVYKVPDATMAGERSQANEFASSGKMESFATTPYGLKAFIDKADLEFADGPFKLWERRKNVQDSSETILRFFLGRPRLGRFLNRSMSSG
ncbi:MAG: hypothetical protein LBP19_10795 [Treponema sp.]|jgi:hypothetical protein|nr:hypothetical protein [Treponema sp.]